MVIIFKTLIIFTIVQRVVELLISKSNEKTIVKAGGKIIPEVNYLFMVILHTLWLGGIAYNAFFVELEINESLFYIGGTFFLVGQVLRITAIKTLGRRWSTRIVILPEAPAINTGIFTFIRHPNYLGVTFELLALPLMASLYFITVSFTLLNFIILFFRIKKEEEALSKYNNYSEIFNLKG